MSEIIQDNDTVQVCNDDVEHYLVVEHRLIRDESISPECRWLIIYLLSNDKSFKIKVKQIVNHLKGHRNCGRDRVYEMIEEAITAGYMKREEIYRGNLKSGCRYFVSKTPKFSKNVSDVLVPSIPAPRIPQSRKHKNYQESKDSKEISIEEKEGSNTPLPSSDAEAAFDFFLKKIRERSPTFKDPSKKEWITSLDRLLRLDKRPLYEVKKLIEWASTHKWWSVACLSADKLRKDYDKMLIQMNAELAANPQENPQVKENTKFVESVRDYLKSEKYRIYIDGKGFAKIAVGAGRTEELTVNMNPAEFKRIALDYLGLKEGS